MRKILIFETNTGRGGHHIEYVHHLYNEALTMHDVNFVFVISDKIESAGKDFNWPKSDNIQFDYVPDNKVANIRRRGRLVGSFRNALLLRDYVKKYNPTEVFLISLINYMPFLPFILPSSVKCSGIIYMIYLYQWKQMPLLKKFGNVLLYLLFSKSNLFSRIFILNDTSSVVYLNKIYKSNKFCYLPDPVVNYPWNEIDIRNKYGIASNERVFLQCGILSSRKFTIEVLEALRYVDYDNVCFIFAGKVSFEIKERFYSMVDELSSSHHIIVVDDFLSYDMMFSFLKSADYVLTMYRETSLSSGFIGHAANFCRPVISRSDGLIGKLVKKNKLGSIVTSMNPKMFAKSIQSVLQKKTYIKTDYAMTHTSKVFAQIILQQWNENA